MVLLVGLPKLEQPVKSFYISDIFGARVQFPPACTEEGFNVGFQTVSSGNSDHYFNQELYYTHRGNQIMIRFHFLDEMRRLYQPVWEKYLMHYSLLPSDFLFIEVKVLYNGEAYMNGKVISKIPQLRYDVYSEVEMTDIDYTIDSINICKTVYRPLDVSCGFSGLIFNGYGNRSIVLDDVVYKLQVLAFDTIYLTKRSPDAITIEPEPKASYITVAWENFIETMEGCVLSEDFGMPSLRYKGKPFICRDRHKLIFRLPPAEFDKALDIPGTLYFNPNENENPKEGWIQVPLRQREHWNRLAEVALNYIKQ